MRRTIAALSVATVLTSLASARAADFREAGFAMLKTIDQRAGHRQDGLFNERLIVPGMPSRRPAGPSTAWAAGVQLAALNAAASLDPTWVKRANDYAVALDQYRGTDPVSHLPAYQPFPGTNGGDIYYDDNEWLVIDFVDTYRLTNDREHLRRAVDAYKFALSGEDEQLGGGIYWRADKHESKNTCSNAPGAAAALELYAVTHEQKYLDDAKRLRDWTTEHLQDNDGLFFDNVKLDGTVEHTKFTYNSALMIRTNARLFEVTQEQRYLDEAVRIADAAESKWFREADGATTDEGAFAHLLCEALIDLDRLSPKPSRMEKVTKALKFLQTFNRNGVYPHRWDGWSPNERGSQLLAQASVARGFLFAAKHLNPQ